jgi:hypothetical protein
MENVASSVCDEGELLNCLIDQIEERDEERDEEKEIDLNDVFLKFLTTLHSNPSMTKKSIDQIFKMLKKDILDPILKCTNDNELRERVGRAHSKLNSFYRYDKQMRQRGFATAGIQKTVDDRIDTVFKRGVPTLGKVTDKVAIMPIKQQIKAFFELPGVFNATIKHMQTLCVQEEMSNIIQGSLWKEIRSRFEDTDVVLPCLIYHDDYEPDNPLGSNAGVNKIAAFYYTFPVIPQWLLSSPEYVFDALLFPSHFKTTQLSESLRPLLQIFNELEMEGIEIEIDGKEQRIYIVVPLLLGDNLAQNELLGLPMSFNATNFCRFCVIPKPETHEQPKEIEDTLRAPSTYDTDLEQKACGLVRPCPFYSLENFHPLKNFSLDLMHDVYEGIARYDVALALKYFIKQKKYFSLAMFNSLKQEFSYGEIEIGNSGREISNENLKNGHVTMSASEMKTLIRFLPMILGQRVPAGDQIFKLLLDLCSLADLLFKSTLSTEEIESIRTSMSSYLKKRIKHFGNLKPKHHLLTHAANVIGKSGPLKHLSCFVFEQKNRQSKQYSKVCFQRKNLSWSLTYKAATRFNDFLNRHENGFPDEISFNPKHLTKITTQELNTRIYLNSAIGDFVHDKEVCELMEMTYKSTTYKPKYYVATDDPNRRGSIFCFMIIAMLKIDDKYYLVGQKQNIQFRNDLKTYFITSRTEEYHLLCFHELTYFPFNHHENEKGEKAFRPKPI